MKNAERWGKEAQSQVHAWSKPGTSHVLGRRLGGASQVHAWYMRGACDIQARYKPGTSQEREESGALVLPSRRARCLAWPNKWFVRRRGAKYLGESNPCTSCRLCRAR